MTSVIVLCPACSIGSATWGHGGERGKEGEQQLGCMEPKDNLSKPVENKENIVLKTLALIPTRIQGAGDIERKEGTARGNWWERGRGMCWSTFNVILN